MAIPRRRWTTRTVHLVPDTHKHSAYVHHTVSPNRSWTRAQEREHLRQLESLHINTNGWSAIGYNLLLFPSGRLYEGRGVPWIPAAQASFNVGTVPIAYVGDGRSAQLTRRARARLIVALLALRANRGIRKLGGHRDAPGQATMCPGDRIYRQLPAIRRRTRLTRP